MYALMKKINYEKNKIFFENAFTSLHLLDGNK